MWNYGPRPVPSYQQRLYKSSHTAKEMIWHATGKCTELGKMQQPVDGKAWKKFDTNQAYNMWPVILTTYNLPPWLCMKGSSFMLMLLIHGPKSLGKDIDVYLRPLIEELKQICSATLMEDDMFKAQIKVVEILCDLELIYPLALFDIMIHLVIHLPLEALEGGPIRPQWMFPFERYTKKLKGYVQTKAKLKGSVAEGYVAEEALTFSSHYFRVVTTKLNRPDHNVDPPPLTCQFQVFRSICKSIGLRLNDLDNVTLHIDGQSTEVDAPPDIIDVVDEDDDIIDDEDALPHDLADSDDEDLINVDDDGVDKMSADVARSHGDDGGGEDRPPPHYVPNACGGCFANRCKGKRKPNLGGRAAGSLNTHDKTRNLSFKEITNTKGFVSIWFEVHDKQTLMPLDPVLSETAHGIPRLDRDPRQHPAALAKSVQYQLGCFQGPTLGTLPEPLKIGKTRQRARSYLDRDLGRLLAVEMRWQSSTTQEYRSFIDTFYVAHTINGEFLRDEERRIY
nr:hypothetical protein [Tanacetum cinerariifolium]